MKVLVNPQSRFFPEREEVFSPRKANRAVIKVVKIAESWRNTYTPQTLSTLKFFGQFQSLMQPSDQGVEKKFTYSVQVNKVAAMPKYGTKKNFKVSCSEPTDGLS